MQRSSDDKERDIYVLLQRTAKLAFKVRGRELGYHGISAMHAAVLDAVHEIGRKATPAEIARRLVREPHTISNLVNRMERQGLVRKVHDLDRKNLVRVEMTPKGEAAYTRLAQRISVHDLLSEISDEECRQISENLRKIHDRAYQLLRKKSR
jgi:DNA-binding MarR family transcriptional regulator